MFRGHLEEMFTALLSPSRDQELFFPPLFTLFEHEEARIRLSLLTQPDLCPTQGGKSFFDDSFPPCAVARHAFLFLGVVL